MKKAMYYCIRSLQVLSRTISSDRGGAAAAAAVSAAAREAERIVLSGSW